MCIWVDVAVPDTCAPALPCPLLRIVLCRWNYAGAAAELALGFEARLQERKRAEQALFNSAYSARTVPTCNPNRSGVCNQPRCT